jgi:hypothetical protein
MFPFTHATTGDDVSFATACAAILFPAFVAVAWFTRDEW